MADVQQFIQNLNPTTANNGNPNTAYNNSPVPVMDAFGNWALPVTSPAATATFQRNTNAPWANVGNVGAGINFPVFPSLPPLTSTPFPTTPVGGGGGGPSVNLPEPPVQIGGRGGTAPSPFTPVPGTIGGDTFNNLFRDPLRPGINPTTGGTIGGLGSMPSWQQFLDSGLDLAGLPGDFYLSGTGKWDLSNILEGLGSAVTGLPISSGLDYLTKLYAGGDLSNLQNAPQWLQDRYLDNLNNLLANTQFSSLQNSTNQSRSAIDQALSNKLAQDLAKYGINTQQSAAEREAARKEAEAQQARDFVAAYTSMPANMQRSAEQSRQAMLRMFGGKER